MLSATASRLMFRLNNVTKQLSGLYSCKVSTYSDETLATKRLKVIGKVKVVLNPIGDGEVFNTPYRKSALRPPIRPRPQNLVTFPISI